MVQLLCAGMWVIGLFHSEWLKPIGVVGGMLIVREGVGEWTVGAEQNLKGLGQGNCSHRQ